MARRGVCTSLGNCTCSDCVEARGGRFPFLSKTNFSEPLPASSNDSGVIAFRNINSTCTYLNRCKCASCTENLDPVSEYIKAFMESRHLKNCTGLAACSCTKCDPTGDIGFAQAEKDANRMALLTNHVQSKLKNMLQSGGATAKFEKKLIEAFEEEIKKTMKRFKKDLELRKRFILPSDPDYIFQNPNGAGAGAGAGAVVAHPSAAAKATAIAAAATGAKLDAQLDETVKLASGVERQFNDAGIDQSKGILFMLPKKLGRFHFVLKGREILWMRNVFPAVLRGDKVTQPKLDVVTMVICNDIMFLASHVAGESDGSQTYMLLHRPVPRDEALAEDVNPELGVYMRLLMDKQEYIVQVQSAEELAHWIRTINQRRGFKSTATLHST